MDRKPVMVGIVAAAALAAVGTLHLAGAFDGEVSCERADPGPAPDVESAGSRVSGVVLDLSGRPLEGADVALLVDEGLMRAQPWEGEVRARRRTGVGGAFVFENVAPEYVYLLRVAHEEHATERRHPVDPLDAATLHQEIRLGTGLEFRGVVTDAEGRPLEGAEVRVEDMMVMVRDPARSVERLALTGAGGRFACRHLRPGLKKVLARKSGFATDGATALDLRESHRAEGITIALGPGHAIGGTVAADDDGRPLAGAVVLARPGGDSRKAFVVTETLSGADGGFELSGLMAGPCVLTVQAAGYETLAAMPAEAGEREVRVRLAAAASISGFVVDADTGAPLPAVSVNEVSGPKCLSGPDGTFTCPDCRPGIRHLLAEGAGYAGFRSGPIEVRSGEQVTGITIRMERGARVAGAVLATDGTPVAGARIVLDRLPAESEDGIENPFERILRKQLRRSARHRAVTDDEGQWSIDHVTAGRYRAIVACPGFAERESSVFACRNGEPLDLGATGIERGAAISGTVLGRDGRPEPSAVVMVTSADKELSFVESVQVREDGCFRLAGLNAGAYRAIVTTRLSAGSSPFDGWSRESPEKTFTLREGEELTLSLGRR